MDHYLRIDLRDFGLKPRSVDGLVGIFSYPWLHADWKHIVDNSVTGFVLLLGLFSFYGRVSWSVILWSWLMSGLWMWIAARGGNHIGFSGVIYALAAFIFFSGVVRRHFRLMALSLIVVFLYGSMIWGILPIQPGISWEGHLFGAVAGIVLALYFRREGPQRPVYSWELEPESDEPESADEFQDPLHDRTSPQGSAGVVYHFKEGANTKKETKVRKGSN